VKNEHVRVILLNNAPRCIYGNMIDNLWIRFADRSSTVFVANDQEKLRIAGRPERFGQCTVDRTNFNDA